MPHETSHDEVIRLRTAFAALRAQMARDRRRRPTSRLLPAILAALLVALIPLATLAANPFTDLNPGSPHNGNIEAIFAAGITTGCDPGVAYCPNDKVTREEMASFLARTAGLGGNPPVANALTAQTVPDGSVTVAKLNAAGVPAGLALVSTGTGVAFQPVGGSSGVTYARTIIVSPRGTPAENGAALRAALAGITTASATNPFLLKIEPGLYDLSAGRLEMKPFVDIEGSGAGVTILQSLPGAAPGTVQGADKAELRHLSIVAITAPDGQAVPLVIGGPGTATRVSDVVLSASGGTNDTGLGVVQGATPLIRNTTITVLGPGTALYTFEGSPTVEGSHLVAGAGGAALNANGIGAIRISNTLIGGSSVIAAGADVKCFGTYRPNYTATTIGCQ